MLVLISFACDFTFTNLVRPLRAGLHDFSGGLLRSNSLEWNSHSASLRLAIRPEGSALGVRPINRTLQPVQLRFLG